MFPVVLDRFAHTAAGILVHSSKQVFSRSFRLGGCRCFSSLHRFSIGFRSGDWLGYSRTLKCFLQSHCLVELAVCLGSLSCWKTQPRTIFNALTEGRRLLAKISRYMAPSILPSIRCSRPFPFAESNPKAWCFQPHASWCSWDCTPPSLSKHGEWSLYQQFLFWSHLTTWPSPMPPLDHPDGLWQSSDRPGHVLAWAEVPCACCRILIHGVVLTIVTVKTVVPALFRSLTRSSRVVLGWSLFLDCLS